MISASIPSSFRNPRFCAIGKSHKLAGKSGHRDSNFVRRMNRRMDEKNREQRQKDLDSLRLLMRYLLLVQPDGSVSRHVVAA